MKRPFSALLSDYINGMLSPDELEEFFAQVPANRDLLVTAIDEKAALDQPLSENKDRTDRMITRLEAALEKIEEPVAPVRRLPFLRPLGRVAAAVLILATGTYFWIASYKKEHPSVAMASKTVDIAPGHNGAVLTLSNNTQVVLDSLGNGIIAAQTGANPLLLNGRLTYDPQKETTAETVYNTVTTPRGRKFQLTLPDGTQVWLNAASSIHYPTVFTGTERKVELTGEGYFEIAKNTKMPFRVKIDNREDIVVMGTHFNVNAYENEKTLTTTLLEGSVRVFDLRQQPTVQNTEKGVVLKPGQQAQIRSEMIVVDNSDLDKVMAWKNGAFNFEGLGLSAAMRQLERWYDIKVTYESGVPDIRFGGKIGQDASLADLLLILSGTKLKFRIEKGRELVIMK
jgi:transmembrane sensor